MSSPPHPLMGKSPYQQAWGAVKRYKHAIAVLNRVNVPRSPELVRGILCTRDNAYIAIHRIPRIWLAEILCNAGLTFLDFLAWAISGLPKPLCWLGKYILRRVPIGHCTLPKHLRKWLHGWAQISFISPLGRLLNNLRLIKAVKDLDTALYEKADELNNDAARIPQELWARLKYPPATDIFGLLDPPKPLPWRDRLDGVWEFFSVALLSASLAILVDISARLFSSGANTQGIQAIIIPSLLTLLAGGGLTRTGREFLGRIFDNLGAPRHWRDEFIFACILVLFIIISLIWINLPGLARNQVQQTHQALCIVKSNIIQNDSTQISVNQENIVQDGIIQSNAENVGKSPPDDCIPQLSKAESGYRLAIQLDPENTEAHYGLGRVYEALQLNEQAIAEYQIAVKGEVQGISYEAYDRLARLFILQGKKDDAYIKAIALSKDGFNRLFNPKTKEQQKISPAALQAIRYNLKKNQGWALLIGQENFVDAKKLLEEAKKLDPDQAPAHCLLAQVNEALHNQKSAGKAWEDCLAFAKSGDFDEERWRNLGRERLTQMYESSIKKGKIALKRNQLTMAQKHFQAAIDQIKEKAAAYCLLAQTEDKLNQLAKAKTHWELCLEYSSQDEQDRENWLDIARKRLKEN